MFIGIFMFLILIAMGVIRSRPQRGERPDAFPADNGPAHGHVPDPPRWR